MTEETIAQILRHANIGQLIMDNHGTINVSYGKKDEESKEVKEQVVPMKNSIMDYVGRLKPIVKEEYLPQYDKIWDGLLELREVKMQVYNKGKQQDTTFNRNLVAQIIYQLKDVLYIPSANSVSMAECLEPDKGVAHPVRQKLGEMPERVIKKSVEEYIKDCF